MAKPREGIPGNSGHMHVYLPDIMPLFAPTVNSYKRLVGTSGAGDGVLGTGTSGRAGLHDQSADDERDATRLEVRVSGADANPHYAPAAIVALGWRGVRRSLQLQFQGRGHDG